MYNDFLMGNNNYPTSFSDVFSLLLNYRKERQKGKDTPTIAEEESTAVNLAQRQQTPTAGKDGILHPNILCYNCNLMGHYSNQCPSPPRATGMQGFQMSTILYHANFNQVSLQDRLNKSSFTSSRYDLRSLILLDTGSTVHLFMNKSLVKGIKRSENTLFLETNGGINVTNDLATYEDDEV